MFSRKRNSPEILPGLNILPCNMFGSFSKIEWKYFRIELCFFIFISYIVSIISDLEYSYYERHNIASFVESLENRIVYGSFAMATYSAYYWLFLKPYVFNKKIAAVIISMVIFFVVQHWVYAYLSPWVIINLPIFSPVLTLDAVNSLKSAHMTFTISYATVREAIPLIGFTFIIRSLQQDEQMKALKEQQLVSELNYLKAQLHPHFFFNTMNNIYSLALKQSKDTAPVVAKLADMMRYILYEADQPKVPLKKEVGFLSNYVEVEQIRHQHNTIQFDVQGINDSLHIEPLLMLPFIENAFKHGLEQETGQGFVNIVLCVMEDELILEVSNSKPQQVNSSAGIGIQNVLKRLTLLYPDKHRLEIKDEPNSYHVILSLQLT